MRDMTAFTIADSTAFDCLPVSQIEGPGAPTPGPNSQRIPEPDRSSGAKKRSGFGAAGAVPEPTLP